MSTRPPAPVRYLILLIAVVCLGCVVCARSRTPEPVAPAPAQAGDPEQVPATAPEAAPVAPEAAPDAAPRPEPRYFPATKAPGHLLQFGGAR